jgi:hypothetical protein
MNSKSPAAAVKKTAAKSKPAAAKAAPKAKAPRAAKPENKREVMLARVESVRLTQRNEGYFDCFGSAAQGYCDQGGCAYHAECLSVSRLLHEV